MKPAYIYLAGFLLMASVFILAAIVYEWAVPDYDKPQKIIGEVRYG